MALAMVLPGIFVEEDFSAKITKLNKVALYASMGALFVLIALLVLCAIQGFSSTL
jgi:hypothetical protein